MIVVLVGYPIYDAIVLLVGFGTILVCTNVGSQVYKYVTPVISHSLVFHSTIIVIVIKLISKLNHR